MHQVFFYLPFINVPVYGYGVMLCVAFIACTWLASRRGRREGFEPQHIQDIGLWIFLLGIVGGRLFSWFFEPQAPGQKFFWDFFKIWHGGLVFYGSVAGGLAGYLVAYFLIVRRHKLSSLQFGDIITPSIAMGICLGRIGCFFTGCCYGDYADPVAVPWGLQFPGNSAPQLKLVERGLQTAYGFVLEEPRGLADRPTVRAVDAHAARAGLRVGDEIVRQVNSIRPDNPRRDDPVEIVVARTGQDVAQGEVNLKLAPLSSLPVHPTQLYSAFDGLVLFLLTTAYYPFRKRTGEVLALLMIAYAVNRYLIEQLRNDTDLVWFNLLTLSQGISVILFVGGVVLFLWVRGRIVSPTPCG